MTCQEIDAVRGTEKYVLESLYSSLPFFVLVFLLDSCNKIIFSGSCSYVSNCARDVWRNVSLVP